MRNLIDRQIAITYPILPKEYRKYQTDSLDDAYQQGWDDMLTALQNLPFTCEGKTILQGDETETEILSILRSEYNLFDEDEEPIYHALSKGIQALNAQKKGKWLIDKDNKQLSVCSECGYETRLVTKFCPNCGAKMNN